MLWFFACGPINTGAEELDTLLLQMGVEDVATRAAQVPALLAQMDPEGTGSITLQQFNVVATGRAAPSNTAPTHACSDGRGLWRRRRGR